MDKIYEVRISKQAERQLKEIIQYISYTLQAPGTAEKMLDLLEREILSLSSFPNRIPLTQDEPWHSQGIHKMVIKNYLVYFWVDENTQTVHIIAVVYGRRDQKQLLAHM